MQDWNSVIEKAVQRGVKPEQVNEMIDMHWQMAQKFAGKSK